ncbi:MAG TPA: hypothetical protein VMW10_03920 [Alphaproteobacteria bacterium]|nr:hypothetical protein [Alphaproteobacteria bacterium]
MRKKIFNLSANTLLSIAFPWSLTIVLGLTIACLGSEQVWGNSREIPGLPIARLALPSICVNPNVGTPTGTLVGEKVVELKKRIQNIETFANSIIHSIREQYEQAIIEVNQYHYFVSEIEAKLQLGTTPSNPKLIDMRNVALQQLDEIADTISMMDELAAGFSESSEQVRFLALQIDETLHMPGAIDEDHAHLILMSDELSTVNEAISQSHETLNANRLRQSEWLGAERVHLANLSSAIDNGKINITGQTTPSKVSLPAILPEPNLLPKKKTRSQRKRDKIQTPVKESPEKLSSEAFPFAPIHQEILQEKAVSFKGERAPHTLNVVSEMHEDIQHEASHEKPIAAPVPPMQVPETHKPSDQNSINEVPATPPTPHETVSKAHKAIHQEVANTKPLAAPMPLQPASETHEDVHQDVREAMPPVPAPLISASEILENNHQDLTHETSTPSSPIPVMLVAEAHKNIQPEEIALDTPAPPSALHERVSEADENSHQQASHEAIAPASALLDSDPQKLPVINMEVPLKTIEGEPQKSIDTPAPPHASGEESLPLISVAAHPEVQPLPDEDLPPQLSQEKEKIPETLMSFSTAAKDRLPLVHLDPNKEIRNQKWVLISSAKRALKKSSDILEIVNVVGENGSSTRGKEVKSLLIETGFKPEQLRLINTKAEENQAEQVYIFINN